MSIEREAECLLTAGSAGSEEACPMAETHGTVSAMGQREEYLKSDSNWNASLTREQRLQRWSSSASFGLALSGKAARAIAASERAVAIAESAREMVHHQAVYALLYEGFTVREIADQLQLSRSRVGRMVRALPKEDGHIRNLGFVPLRDANEATRELVYSAWQMPTNASAVEDHPRGTIEPSHTQQTNFGGVAASPKGEYETD